jgi:flagellar biosynthesis protein FliR
LAELAVGASLGLAGALIVGALRQPGEIVAAHAGLAPAGLLTADHVDAAAQGDDPLTAFGHLYGLIAIAAFLGLDGPLRLVDAIAASYQGVPPGFGVQSATLEHAADMRLFREAGQALLLTARAAAPAGLAMVFAGVVVAVLARGGRSSPLAGLAWPLRWLLGLAIVALTLPGVLGTAEVAWTVWFQALPRRAGGT